MNIKQLEKNLDPYISQDPVSSEPAGELQHSDQFSVYLIWNGLEPLLPGREYMFDHKNAKVTCTISGLKYRLDPQNGEHLAADTLNRQEIGNCNIELDRSIDYMAARNDRELGSFQLCDKLTGEVVAAGLINFGLRRATNIQWQSLEINKKERASAKKQKPHAIWFTGLSGSGKSTIASLLEKKLHSMGRHTYVMDGDNVRHGLCRDLGFTDADRVENIRRVAETAKLFVDAGLIVIVSFISPFISERRMARELFDEDEFKEVFVDTPLEVCEQRDPKGLYKKARQGEIRNFTGLDSPYERPERAEITLSGNNLSPEQQVGEILQYLEQRKLI